MGIFHWVVPVETDFFQVWAKALLYCAFQILNLKVKVIHNR
jgi:hypothetical protein